MIEIGEFLKWGATIFITISAVLVSFNINWSTKWWAYVGFLVGHIVWLIASYHIEEWSLLWLNAAFVALDSYAIYIRINKEIGDKNATSSFNEIN